MSVHLTSKVWRIRMSCTKKLILMKLADCASDTGESVYPSVGRVAAECGVSERTVQYVLREFETEGLLVAVDNLGGGRNRPRVYVIDIERLAALSEKGATREPVSGGNGANGEKGATDDDENGVKGANDDSKAEASASKGATDDEKGCKAFAPEPSVEPSEEKTGKRFSDENPESGEPPDPEFSDDPPPRPDERPSCGTAIPLEAFGIAAPPPNGDVPRMVELWNALANELDLSRVQKLTASRRKKATARLKDCGGIEGFEAALTKVRSAPWMWDGTARNGWKANFDFLLQESSFVKLMEGGYDGRSKPARADAMADAWSSLDAELTGCM